MHHCLRGWTPLVSSSSDSQSQVWIKQEDDARWFSGNFSVLLQEGRRFESHSSRHIGTLGISGVCAHLFLCGLNMVPGLSRSRRSHLGNTRHCTLLVLAEGIIGTV